MKIQDIYNKYSIPTHLREHMLKAAAVGYLICDNFKKNLINKNLIVKTLLLHDMGNIIKFDFTRLDIFAEEDRTRISELKSLQQKFINKFGNDADKATLTIIREISSNEVLGLCRLTHWKLVEKFVDCDYWDRKIVLYSDMRTGPFGVTSLKDRINDLEKRKPEIKSVLQPFLKKSMKIEKQLQKLVQIDLLKINEEMIINVIHDITLNVDF